MKFRLIACEIFSRELAWAAARSPNRVSLRFLPFKLHQEGGKAMGAKLQQAIDETPDGFDAVLLAYGLCENGLLGLRARNAPLVAFRSHDCIACLLGDAALFKKEREERPGTYWLSSGWIEQGGDASESLANMPSAPAQDDPQWLSDVEKYGEDNALFLWEERKKALAHYDRLVYIDTGLGPQAEMEAEAKRRAEALNLEFKKANGDRAWIEGLLAGDWDEKRFLVVPPGHEIAPRYDDSVFFAKAPEAETR